MACPLDHGYPLTQRHVLLRARSVKLVSGVFHYWSSPITKIVCTQG